MISLNSPANNLADFWKGEILWDSPMSHFSTLKVGGPAEAIIRVNSITDLTKLVQWLTGNRVDWWVLGRGSNILVSDNGIAGVIIVLDGEFRSIEKLEAPLPLKDEKVFIRAGGGCQLAKLVNYCTSQSLTGLEFAVGIPGSVGGAIVMNAGAWGSEIGSCTESIELMAANGAVFAVQGKNLGFAYRKSSLPARTILLSATLVLTPGDRNDIKGACLKYQSLRRKKQPLDEPSAGSIFKNPPNDSAGRLIEAAGLKGFSIGGAKISDKHANFIINTGKASAADIIELMRTIQLEVKKHFGIELEPEVQILGEH